MPNSNKLYSNERDGRNVSGAIRGTTSDSQVAFFKNAADSLSGSWRKVVIVTAFIDLDALLSIANIAVNKWDGRVSPNIEVFLDARSLTKLHAEFARRAEFAKGDAGFLPSNQRRLLVSMFNFYAMNTGALFHSKAMLIETNAGTWSAVGSLNFTTRAFSSNEEILFTAHEDFTASGKYRGVAKEIGDYVVFLRTINNASCSIDQWNAADDIVVASDLRGFMLNGCLWYETPESGLFLVNLQLPDEVRKTSQISTIPFLDSKLSSTVSLESVLTKAGLLNRLVNTNASETAALATNDSEEGTYWKRNLCVQTCYGLWSPHAWKNEVVSRAHRLGVDKQSRLDDFCAMLEDHKNSNAIEDALFGAVDQIWTSIVEQAPHLKHSSLIPTSEKRQRILRDALVRVKSRINDTRYRERFVNAVDCVEVPDLWSLNATEHEEFEESFLENLLYQMRRRSSGGNCSSILGRLLLDKFCVDPEEDSFALREKIQRSAEELDEEMAIFFQ